MSSKSARYQQQIHDALARSYAEARESPACQASYNLATDRYIIFSDHHKGARNGADDFRGCERAYNAALAYYFSQGYTLVVLGDAEELWEERIRPVLNHYRRTLLLEADFHQAGRYLRFWGNHDDAWRYPDLVKRHLEPIFQGPPLQVHESVLVTVRDGAQTLGSLMLVHGHQGTLESDRFSWLSRLFVRFVWRPIQRLTGKSVNTPAKDWQLRDQHNVAMYGWARQQDRLVLIAGHTHRPVFKSQSHEAQVLEQLGQLEQQLRAAPQDAGLIEQRSLLLAQLEWIRAQQSDEDSGHEQIIAMEQPCYFNTGCCSFFDGDITGIELAGGEIRLVRWPDDKQDPRPKILERAPLAQVFRECTLQRS